VEASSVWGCSRPEPGLATAAFNGTGSGPSACAGAAGRQAL
jgi:hypothetical protein